MVITIKKKEYVCYIGKDSNINKNNRHKAHYETCNYDRQKINSVLQNNPNRYDYFILAEGNFSDNELNDMEKQAIEIFKTFKYDYPKRSVFNFTCGGEGISGYNYPEEIKRKKSESMSGENHPNSGTCDSGILYVYKTKDKTCKQNYAWRYKKIIHGKRYEKQSVNLRKLEKNVLKDNQEWIVINKEKAKKSYQESDKNNNKVI